MILIINEFRDEFKDPRKNGKEFPMGWWVSVNDGRIYNVSSDLGPGDHMGYAYSIDNGGKLGLTDEQMQAIDVAYATDFRFKIEYNDSGEVSDNNWWKDDDEFEPVYMKLIPSKSKSEWNKLYDSAIDYLHSHYIRALYSERNKSLNIQVYSDSKKYYDAFMRFLIEFLDAYKVDSVFVEIYDDSTIWNNYSIEDALSSKKF
jgi:hypothetical protein